ncbi:Uncharacterized protein ImpA [Marinobacterium lacunae]|uniref:Uncharacterized protein ImpA n=1 Tax=Marinobacterium lacunae TaxID=1232683 RepID=A0A081G3A9_9GAMM|nr:type VI secretion system protein TssA [Marinobacterium lacunae]KEA65264.1 Uncharacterized protein ImpA [Marinobacterium lacunae]
MELDQYLDKVIRPISDDNPVGERLTDDVLFDYIESQMMKVGSLSHGEVQWLEVERAAMRLLESKTKDLKLLTHLLQCLQYQCSVERFSCSLALLQAFMREFWESCYPVPGPRGVLPRRKFFSQIVQRTVKAADGLDTDFCDPDTRSILQRTLGELCKTAADHELPVSELEELKSQLDRRLQAEPRREKASAGRAEERGQAISAAPEVRDIPKLEIDNSSDKSTRQALLKLADFISETPSGMALSLRMRRFAIWSGLTSAPENANDKGETSLMPPSGDRVSEYRTQLEKSPDLALLRRIEQSLSLSPFWLDGHHLSAQLAVSLGQQGWADAIREETLAFVERLPALAKMTFKGGTPFASKETQQWLANGGTSSAVSGAHDSVTLDKEIHELAREGGLALALGALNQKLDKASEPRDRFYLRLIGAELKEQYQLGAMADLEYQVLLTQASSTDLKAWEPSLMSRLQNKVKQG